MKFVMAICKHKAAGAGRAEGHNVRLHGTSSQLPQPAWFAQTGHHQAQAWDTSKLAKAASLAKRKDAVHAIELVIQVGNQSDWRHPPTKEHPHGKPKGGPGQSKALKALLAGAKAAITAEFGASNIVGLSLHLDESSPHVHAVVTPITKAGKLQAKSWLDGPSKCAALRRRVHAHVSRHIACDYTPGGEGGEPHDPGKAAGAPRGPQKPPGLLDRAKGALEAVMGIPEAQKAAKEALEQRNKLFSAAKRSEAEALALRQARYEDEKQATKRATAMLVQIEEERRRMRDREEEMRRKLAEAEAAAAAAAASARAQVAELEDRIEALDSQLAELAPPPPPPAPEFEVPDFSLGT